MPAVYPARRTRKRGTAAKAGALKRKAEDMNESEAEATLIAIETLEEIAGDPKASPEARIDAKRELRRLAQRHEERKRSRDSR